MDNRHSPTPYFAVCLNNEGYPASLEVDKLYRVIPDDEAAVHGYIRVIDESGEDYGYSIELTDKLHLFNNRSYAVDVPSRSATGAVGLDGPLSLTRRRSQTA
jgi:hypothetical protein